LVDRQPQTGPDDRLRNRGFGESFSRCAIAERSGEAQRIKLATELQRSQRGRSLYVLDEPTTGLHAADVDRLMLQLHRLVDAGNSVVVIEHEMRVVAQADWVIDMGPGAGESGGRVVVEGHPEAVTRARGSRTATFLRTASPERSGY
jgi:excinuclease ABC subunit A